MTEIRFVVQNATQPPSSGFAVRIKPEEWDIYKDIIREAHERGVIREDIRVLLANDHGFHPSAGQLQVQMKRWNLTVYKKSNSSVARAEPSNRVMTKINSPRNLALPGAMSIPGSTRTLMTIQPRENYIDVEGFLHTAEILFSVDLHSMSWSFFHAAAHMPTEATDSVRSILGCVKTATSASQIEQTFEMISQRFLDQAAMMEDQPLCPLLTFCLRRLRRYSSDSLPSCQSSISSITLNRHVWNTAMGRPALDSDEQTPVPVGKIVLDRCLTCNRCTELSIVPGRDPSEICARMVFMLTSDQLTLDFIAEILQPASTTAVAKHAVFEAIYWHCLGVMRADPYFWSASFSCVGVVGFWDIGGPATIGAMAHVMADYPPHVRSLSHLLAFWRSLCSEPEPLRDLFVSQATEQLISSQGYRIRASERGLSTFAQAHLKKIVPAAMYSICNTFVTVPLPDPRETMHRGTTVQFHNSAATSTDIRQVVHDTQRADAAAADKISVARTFRGSLPQRQSAQSIRSASSRMSVDTNASLVDPTLAAQPRLSSGSFRSFNSLVKRLGAVSSMQAGRLSSNPSIYSKRSFMSLSSDLSDDFSKMMRISQDATRHRRSESSLYSNQRENGLTTET